MVIVAQLVRALDCGSRGRGFETHHSPQEEAVQAVIDDGVKMTKKGLE